MNTLVLKIDGCRHVVQFTATEDNVVVRSVAFYNVVKSGDAIPAMLKFRIQQALAEILNGEVDVDNVDVKS